MLHKDMNQENKIGSSPESRGTKPDIRKYSQERGNPTSSQTQNKESDKM